VLEPGKDRHAVCHIIDVPGHGKPDIDQVARVQERGIAKFLACGRGAPQQKRLVRRGGDAGEIRENPVKHPGFERHEEDPRQGLPDMGDGKELCKIPDENPN
jgi:hypothetical protein